MKKTITFLIVLFLSLHTLAQWQQTNGPFGGNIQCMATNGNNVYAGTYNGVYVSANNGTNWTLQTNGLASTDVRSIVFCGTTIFAGTSGGIYSSTNLGNNWIAVNTGM